jgi:GH24 family phage-related lysozyme (muramidase)
MGLGLKLHYPTAGRELDFETLYSHIKKWEGVVTFMYLDTHEPPLVTVGCGNMLPNVAAAKALPFVNTRTNAPATAEEVEAAWAAVTSMPGGQQAKKYKQKVSIEIPEAKAKELAIARLKREFVPQLRKLFQGFDRLPLPAREALVDMAYNGGVGRAEKTVKGKFYKATGLYAYRNPRAAVEDGDWERAARSCGSKSSRKERTEFRQKLFEQAGRIAARAAGKDGNLRLFDNPKSLSFRYGGT